MNRSKKIFIACFFLFFAFLAFIIYDISRKTTFPGSKSSGKAPKADTAQQNRDSIKSIPSPKSATHQP